MSKAAAFLFVALSIVLVLQPLSSAKHGRTQSEIRISLCSICLVSSEESTIHIVCWKLKTACSEFCTFSECS